MKTLIEIQSETKNYNLSAIVDNTIYRITNSAKHYELTSIIIVEKIDDDEEFQSSIDDGILTVETGKTDHYVEVIEKLTVHKFFEGCAVVRTIEGLVIYLPPFPNGIAVV